MLKRLVIAAFMLLALTTAGGGTPIPVTTIDDLVQQAEIVAVGRFADISQTGTTIIQGVIGRDLFGTLHVDQVLKGELQESSLRIKYAEPQEPLGYRGVATDAYGVFFLRLWNGELRFANPYYPYAAAIPGFQASASSPVDRVYEVVANVLRVSGSAANKMEAIALLRQSPNPIATNALRSTVGDPDQELALRAAAALISKGDPLALQRIESVLEGNRAGVSEETYMSILGALEDLTEPSALATLERLFVRGDVGTRRATLRALRNSYSKAAVRTLLRALDDDDFGVRHNAVMALSEAFNQPQWGPSVDAFTDDERRYISLWKEWAKQRR